MKIKNHISKHIRIYKALIVALLPLLLCVITTFIKGFSIGDVYLPSGEWNDELFYYKQVESILSYGFPQGYFGFNESHAEVLSFAAWSPVLVWPWLIWGFCFGWNLLSPIYANIFVMTVALFVFIYLVKPNWKDTLKLVVAYSLFTPFTRYMLSGMPECLCIAMLIVYCATAIEYHKKEKTSLLIAMFINASVMTLMRPYFIMFLVLPAIYFIARKKWIGLVISGAIIGATGGLYGVINKLLGAEYFTALYDTTWISTFFTKGIVEGISFIAHKLYNVGWDFIGKCQQAIFTGLASGIYFLAFLTLFIILLGYAIYQWLKKEKKESAFYAYFSICYFGMLLAILLMYKLTEGSKHLITFIGVGIFLVSMMKQKFYVPSIIMSLAFVYLFGIKAVEPYDFAIPYQNKELVAEITATKEVLSEKMVLDLQQVPTFDNTIIWALADGVEGGVQITDWQLLYALPEGMGISCSTIQYVMDNFNALKSKYICMPQNGTMEQMCREENMEEIARGINSVIYKLK